MTHSATGKRVVLKAYGETPLDALEHHLHLEPQRYPDVAELGPNDVIVAVRSAAVGWVDLIMSSGQYQHMVQPPYCPGLEYAGEVVWVGAGAAATWAVGDRVIADGLLTGPRSLGGYQSWGGFATFTVAPADALRRLPAGWSFDEGACLLGNYETAYHCLIARGRLKAGETVLIHGASGSTGLAAVHVAKLVGATVIATGRNAEKLEIVRQQGADHIVNTSDANGGLAGLRDAVKALTGGSGVDVVYDGVGGPISAESLRAMAFGARFLIVGWAATPFVAGGKGTRGAPNANVLPTNLIMMKGIDVLGCPTVITSHREPAVRVARLAQIDAWIAEGRLRPFISQAFALDDFREAMRAKWESRYVGGCVLHP
jgi:NADPH2:quinone reductase